MAAYAKVKLTKDGRLHGADYKKDDVLRVESATAQRLIRQERAEAYTGTAKAKNETEEKAEAK